MSRPRRFGKSLLLSTMKAYLEGKRELFRGLKIEELEGDGDDAWIQYPVFYFDLNKKNFKRETALEEVLAQIDTQGYALPYAADKRKLFKIGVNFDSEKRTITEWRVEVLHSG